MAGEQYDGDNIRHFKPKDSHAFCEGMRHRTTGFGDVVPISDNPYDGEGSDREDAWDAGWTAANDNAEGTISAADAGPCDCVGASVPAATEPV